jgi:PAS domain S-box-containing protein
MTGHGTGIPNRILSEPAASGSWNWNVLAGRLHVDARFAELYGFEPDEIADGLPTASFFKAIHPDDRIRMRIAVAGMLAGSETFSKEFRIIAPDGAVLWMHGRGHSQIDAAGQPIRFSGFLVDVTERKRAEERLRIVQSAGGIGTFEYVAGFATVTVSDEFCRLLGLHPTSVLPVRTINAVLAPGQTLLIPDAEHGAALPDSMDGDFRITRAGLGDERWIARRGEVLRDWGGSGFRLIGVIYDITALKRQEAELRRWAETLEARVEQVLAERQRAEEALRQAQKMEAVGQLTGGIAHDFNNLLTGITGSLELLGTRVAQGRVKDVDRYINAAQGAARRAAALTHRLLAFSRRQTLDPKPTDMNRLVSGMEELIRRTVGPEIAIEVVAAGGLWPTLVDPPQLENALLNLCINARDAMPDGGRITVETANKWLDDRAARERDLPPGQYVSLCVTDTGVGMSPEVIARAFDPFFTTKPLGQGTGLGLSMIYGFVRQSGGQVRIYSEVGQGTTMCLYLPRHYGEADTADGLSELADAPRAGQGETVLVVDDEATVRMLVTEVLEDLGYAAVEAADGTSGLKVLQSDLRVDLLVTDVGLPGGMNGRQLADAARALRPDLRILFITGYAENAVVGNGLLGHGMQVLTKPFAMDALAGRIRELIASR